jgi:hypothetical protein
MAGGLQSLHGQGTGGSEQRLGLRIGLVAHPLHFINGYRGRKIPKIFNHGQQQAASHVLLRQCCLSKLDLGSNLRGAEVCRVGVGKIIPFCHEQRSSGVDNLLIYFLDEEIQCTGLLYFTTRQQSDGTALVCRRPYRRIELYVAIRPLKNSRELLLRSAGVLLNILKYHQIVLQLGRARAPLLGLDAEDFVVVLAFAAQCLAKFSELVVVVNEFNGLLNANRDAKADDDDRDMNEEIPPSVYRRVGRMYVEHECGTLQGMSKVYFNGNGCATRASAVSCSMPAFRAVLLDLSGRRLADKALLTPGFIDN